ncbi:jg16190 [Pararge aegeria aegeria]|uniref:Jg16190 protein n=1 Tax=Pararge aegeria aegeria TaxID=348720 RepID=A0A8S4RD31_9NEOP|nr:jg16190 [Pararge aegeria aegeria]
MIIVQKSTNTLINVEPSRGPSPRRRHPRVDVEPWGSSHGELSRSPHSPGDVVATPQVVIGKCPSENRIEINAPQSYMDSNDAKIPPGVLVVCQYMCRFISIQRS